MYLYIKSCSARSSLPVLMIAGNHTIVNMVFCAYCGKSFTRKEHLERHIPSHTNVKPHRCTNCQLSFARRDLLQRHYATYHEIRDPSLPSPQTVSSVAGRTPIACLNCASAKTGCDKRVPCSRCADKSLPCAARFARRSSKLFARAMAPPETASQAPKAVAEAIPRENSINTPSANPPIDPRLQSPIHNPPPSNGFEEHSPAKLEIFDDFMPYNDGLDSTGIYYQDMLSWNDLSLDMQIYGDLTAPLDSLNPMYMDEAATSSNSVISATSTMLKTTRSSRSSTDELDRDELPPAKRQKLSYSATPEFDEVLESESAWPLARCNPPTFSDSCPRTAIVHLTNLAKNSNDDNGWTSLDVEHFQPSFDGVQVEPITSNSRDTLQALTQGFLQRALKTHSGGKTSSEKSSFLLLPPTHVLDQLLKSYASGLSTSYSLAAGGTINPNQLLHGNQASSLLVLLMIAQGATSYSSTDAKCLSAGLIETCRISLFDTIERDVELCADPTVLRCAYLFTALGAWSGDKWHMDIVMGQRGMYLAMLKHAGMLEPSDAAFSILTNGTEYEKKWRDWLGHEFRSRLVYDWVLIDQELSLFHDLSSILSISELETPLPHSNEALFNAPSYAAWSSCLASEPSRQLPMSLHDLFQDFLHDNITQTSYLTPLTLRLLLHPIQTLLYQVRQVLTCFPDVLPNRRAQNRSLSKASTLTRLDEVQSLLQRWHTLHSSLPSSAPNSVDELCKTINLVIYHLICLNVHTSFPALEALARRAPATLAAPNPYWEISLQHKKCIEDSPSALFHCGQIIRLLSSLNSMPSDPSNGPLAQPDRRPPWSAIAIYRATLVLWIDVLAKSDPAFPQSTQSGSVVTLNELLPDDQRLQAWLYNGEGAPMLMGRDGRAIALTKATEVLDLCIDFVDPGVSGGENGEGSGKRLAGGIVRKLKVLRENWHGVGGL